MNIQFFKYRVKEIKDPSSTRAGKMKFVCGLHKLEFCDDCRMDFQLMNSLRYDPNYPPPNSNNLGYLSDATSTFYQRNRRWVVPVLNFDPRITSLVEYLHKQTEKGEHVNLEDMIESFSYIAFMLHWMPFGIEQIIGSLEDIIDSLKSLETDTVLPSRQAIYESYKNYAKVLKAHRKASSKAGEGRLQKAEKNIEMMQSSVLKMQSVLEKNNIAELGGFFVEVSKAVEDMVDVEQNFDQINAMDLSAVSTIVDGKVKLPQDMQNFLHKENAWSVLLDSHGEGGMVRMEVDPVEWDKKDIINFLNRHHMKLEPFPKRDIADVIARELVRFRTACVSILNSLPNVHQNEALTRQSMGIADDEDKAIIAEMHAPVKKRDFIVEPQILPNFVLSGCSTRHFPNLENRFVSKRLLHAGSFYQKSFHLVLECVENVTETWDIIQESGDDIVDMWDSSEHTREKNLTIRPIELWSFTCPSEPGVNIPLLGVEYIHSVDINEGPKAILNFHRGLRSGITRHRRTCVDEEVMDMFVSLLDGNRRQLDSDDAMLKKLKKKVHKGWKFSVLRPVNPSKQSGIMICPECGKVATKTCARCKMMAYCSRECQAAQWKRHKKICKPLSRKN